MTHVVVSSESILASGVNGKSYPYWPGGEIALVEGMAWPLS